MGLMNNFINILPLLFLKGFGLADVSKVVDGYHAKMHTSVLTEVEV